MKKSLVVVCSIAGFFCLMSLAYGKDAAYVGTKKCKMCHRKQYKTWESSKHSSNFSVLLEDEKKDAECLVCHTTGFGKGGYDMNKSAEVNAKFENVGCESCHGAGSVHAKAKKADKKAAISRKVNTCTECHNPHKSFKKMAEERRAK